MTQTLYDKYRPATFDQVVGQGAAVAAFEGLLNKGTNRTFLLIGPSGTGKTTLARIGASVLGFQINEYDAASNTGIDNMREVMQGLSYKPLDSTKGKAIIIDECHRLSANAWDSMLKNLEEPRAWVRWFLCTTDPSKVPAAVQTRASKIQLKLVDEDTLFSMLDKIATKERILEDDINGKILDLCVRYAAGSPRLAIVNLAACAHAKDLAQAKDMLLAAEGDDIAAAVDLARALVGGTSWEKVQPILKGLEKENPESVRHVVRGYVTKVILGSTKSGVAGRHMAILEAFSKPFHSADGMSPLVLAVGTLLLA